MWICVLLSPHCPELIHSEISRLRPIVHYTIKGVLPMVVASVFTAIVLDMDSHVDVLDPENLEEIQVLSKDKGLIRRGKEAKVYQYDQEDPDRVFDDDYDGVDYDDTLKSTTRAQKLNSIAITKHTKDFRSTDEGKTKKNYVRIKKRRSQKKGRDMKTKDDNQSLNRHTKDNLEAKNSNKEVVKKKDYIKVKRRDASPKILHQN